MATAGPNYASSITDDATEGTKTWSNPSNAASNNNVYADVALSTTVDGTASQNTIRLLKAGAQVGTDKSTGASLPASAEAETTFGSASDLWGTTWTGAEVSATNFGVVVGVTGPATSHLLNCQQFGFSLTGSTINGLTVKIGWYYTNSFGSFVAGTLVNTQQGLKKVEDVTIGDVVLSFDDKMKLVTNKVTGLKRNTSKGTVYTIRTLTKEVETTSDHKFKTPSGWVMAKHLTIGQEVYTYSSTGVMVEKVAGVMARKESVPVFCFEVENTHAFFANSFAVHNEPIGGFTNAYVDYVNVTIDYTAGASRRIFVVS